MLYVLSGLCTNVFEYVYAWRKVERTVNIFCEYHSNILNYNDSVSVNLWLHSCFDIICSVCQNVFKFTIFIEHSA